MVGGLDKFRETFRRFSDHFVIIGGTACDEVLRGTAISPRVTRDIDIIVITEKMTVEFAKAFWNFIAEGGYRPGIRKSEGNVRYVLYSFDDGKRGFPVKIELLSHHNEVLGALRPGHIEPIPIGGDVSSLSAIILDEPFYTFTVNHSFLSDGLRFASPAALIVLKARAYLNLLKDKESGIHVNSHDILKHRNDVFRLVAMMPVGKTFPVEERIMDTISEFQEHVRQTLPNLSLQDALKKDSTVINSYLSLLPSFYKTDSE